MTTDVTCSRSLKAAKAWLILAILPVALALAAVSAGADVLVDNVGSGTAFDDIQGPMANGYWQGETRGAVSFTVPTPSDYYLSSISVVAKYIEGTNTLFELALYDNNPNDTRSPIPGSEIVSQSTIVNTNGDFATYTADFGTSALLTSGATYWAVVQTSGSDSDLHLGVLKGLTGSSLLPSARRAMYGNMLKHGDTGTVAPYWMHMFNDSIRVTGSPVPEPTSLAALSGGILSLIGFATRRRGKQVGVLLRRNAAPSQQLR